MIAHTKSNTFALSEIQNKLVAKKDTYNAFGKYKYRSCESILTALKPILEKYNYSIVFDDEITAVVDRVYVKTTCSLLDGDGSLVARTCAFAREALVKKGMDESQCTGAASSYARKYALCGMFAIDDSDLDPDKTNDHKVGSALTDKDREHILGAESKEDLISICKALVDAGKNKDEVTNAYKAASARFAK